MRGANPHSHAWRRAPRGGGAGGVRHEGARRGGEVMRGRGRIRTPGGVRHGRREERSRFCTPGGVRHEGEGRAGGRGSRHAPRRGRLRMPS